jgi:hypothetical protein
VPHDSLIVFLTFTHLLKKDLQSQMTLRDEYERLGYLAQAIPLADASVLPELLADETAFSEELGSMRAEGRRGIPYLLTDAICRVARDPAILDTVEAILGTRELVMWGANIRRATPNEAHRWHVDLESLLWPTITVAVGLSGCSPESATWCVPGTHLLSRQAPASEIELLSHAAPKQFSGFGNGRFYVFNARIWHRGDPKTSGERVVAFLHYQRASEPRIPLMLDHQKELWSRDASPFIATASARSLNRDVARLSALYQLGAWWRRLRAR